MLRKSATDSYADALRVVFICQVALNFLTFLSCMAIRENPLPYVITCSPLGVSQYSLAGRSRSKNPNIGVTLCSDDGGYLTRRICAVGAGIS
jgi:hypothetical protein